VGYFYPSGLEKTLCKRDIYICPAGHKIVKIHRLHNFKIASIRAIKYYIILYVICTFGGTVLVTRLVEVLRYKPEGREFDFRWCHWIFSLTLWHYGPGVDSASNRNEYQECFLGVKAAGA